MLATKTCNHCPWSILIHGKKKNSFQLIALNPFIISEKCLHYYIVNNVLQNKPNTVYSHHQRFHARISKFSTVYSLIITQGGLSNIWSFTVLYPPSLLLLCNNRTNKFVFQTAWLTLFNIKSRSAIGKILKQIDIKFSANIWTQLHISTVLHIILLATLPKQWTNKFMFQQA